ncbi:MAG: hypothetical protein JWN61_1705 [Pseudonocardiales bacterium]|nr:hypothetical protein [Pseudonocardiales bacterium]
MSESGFAAPRFVTPPLVRRGYDTRQVDAFVRRVGDTLRGTSAAPVTARDLVTAKFRRVMPLAHGYACTDVDAFLFDIAPALIRANSARAAVAVAPQRALIPEQRQARRWLGRLVNRPN